MGMLLHGDSYGHYQLNQLQNEPRCQHSEKASEAGPVVITDRGRPPHVLMTYGDFERLIGKHHNLVDALSMPGLSNIDFDPPRLVITSREIDSS